MVHSPLPEDPRQKAHHIFLSFRKVHKVFHQMFTKIAEGHDLTPVQLMVMKHLHDHPGLSLTELAEKLSATNSTMSGIIDRMVKAELIIRNRLESDRRAISLSLTDRGKQLWHQTENMRMLMLAPVVQLPDEEIIPMLQSHEKIIEILLQQIQQTREEPKNE